MAGLFLVILNTGISFPAQARQTQKKVVLTQGFFHGLKYRCVGPSRGGRVTAVAGTAAHPATFYMGASGGGVWKTTDYGRSWKNISDGYFATGSIGAIQVADSDPNVIYVGTGSDGIRSNVITGRGVYKSMDAGKTWQFIGLRNVGQIGAVEVHPQNPDLVYIAAIGHAFGPNPERGVYRSKDGGKNWGKVLFLSDTTGAVDLELAPNNPDEIYACMWRVERKPWTIISGGLEGGVYKSEDGGDTWKKLTNGLPQGLFGKSDLAVSPADPNRIYVLIEAPVGEGGLYRSDDRGKSFKPVTTKKKLLDRPFYYCNLDADPTDANVLYVNTTGFFKSIDAGKTWQRKSTPHGDNHDMWINPENPAIFIQSNDGGAAVTLDGGISWSTEWNQPTAELYQVEVDDQFPFRLYAGQQDNSTIMVPSLPPYSPAAGAIGFWRAVGGCETGPAVPKPGNHNIVYANCKGRFGRYNKLTGQEKQYYVGAANIYGHNPMDLKFRFQRVSPILISPHDADVIYYGSQYLLKTTDEGVNWEIVSPDLTAFEPDKQVISGAPITRDITGEEYYSTIYAIRESPIEQGVIWVGANDGPVHLTRDGGKTWQDVTPADLPSGGRVQNIDASPHRAGKAYIAVYRYLLDDWQPYIYRTENYGKTWTRLTTGVNGIPADYPTRVVREDPDREGLLYAGTEFGMFISFDDGEHWQKFQLNLPVTPVTDIKLFRENLVLSTMGRSFWILDDVTPLHQLSPEIIFSPLHLFEPRSAYRMWYRGVRGADGVPTYPQPGVNIDYFFAKAAGKKIKLEILNGSNDVIRTYSTSASSKKQTAVQQEMRSFRRESFTLAGSAGMHRIVWDLRHGAVSGTNRVKSGPVVAPGKYSARLTVGNRRQTVDFTVLMDPRVAADGVTRADLLEQEKLSLQIWHLLNRAGETADRIKKARKELSEKITGGSRSAKKAGKADRLLQVVQSKLVTNNEIRYPTPMLLDQISYLYAMLNRADQKPGKDAYERFTELSKLFAGIDAELEEILK